MTSGIIGKVTTTIDLFFPEVWLKPALVLAFLSTWLVIGLFAYLNRYTKKAYFGQWTVAWMFYAIYLGASIGLEESPDAPFLIMVRRACVGISALFMFWGSMQFTRRERKQRELAMGTIMLLVWSYVGAYMVVDRLWITAPVFMLLGIASAYTGLLYARYCRNYRGSRILSAGFFLWSVHLFCFPFQNRLSTGLEVGGYFLNAVLALFIAMGMMILVLERARESSEALLCEVKQGAARRDALEREINASEEKYRALFESANDAIFLVDGEMLVILEVNESARRLTGYSARDLVDRNFLDLCPNLRRDSQSASDHRKLLQATFRSSNKFQIARADGGTISCEGSAQLVECGQRAVFQINVRERVRGEETDAQPRWSESSTHSSN